MSFQGIGDYANVQGVATEQTITTQPAILHRIVAVNTDAAAQTILVEDGASTEIVTLTLQPNEHGTFHFGCRCPDGIRVTPSDAQLEMAVIYEARTSV